MDESRPGVVRLLAYVATQNVGSIRVLEKCGFTRAVEHEVTANARGDAVEEYTFTLVK